VSVRKGSEWLCVVEGSAETRTILINFCMCKAVHKNSSVHRNRRAECTE